MSRLRWETNLDDLCRRLEGYARTNLLAVPAQMSQKAKRLSDSLYLAHSTADAEFAAICGSGYLTAANKPLLPTRTEVVMGTADSVFFYVAPFRYPNTGCGLLFAATLESARREDGTATPFDSGGLVDRMTRPDPAEPRWPGPIGLTGGDQRQWTHEVRFPDRVFVRGSHLQAVFAPRARVAADARIEALFRWCTVEDVDRIVFDAPKGNDFEPLHRECLAYVQRTLS